MSAEDDRRRQPAVITSPTAADDGDGSDSLRRGSTAISMPTSELILTSMLLKKSPKGIAGLKAWQLRYFMLFEERIIYKKDASPTSPILGDIPIAYVLSAQHMVSKGELRFDIALLGDDRTFSLKAASSSLAQEWVNKINKQVSKINTDGDVNLKIATLRQASISLSSSSSRIGSLKKQNTIKFWKNPQEVMASMIMFSNQPSSDSGPALPVASEDSKRSDVSATASEDRMSQDPGSTTSSKYRRGSSVRNPARLDVELSLSSSTTAPLALSVTPSIPELSHNLRDYQISDMLGEGPFGKIYRAKCLDNDQYFLLHIVKQGGPTYERGMASMESMKGLNHPFLVRQEQRGEDQESNSFWALLTYAHGGPLFTFLRKLKRFTEDVVAFFAAEVACAIGYCHSQDRLVRNLAVENVWVDQDGHVLVCEFDLATVASNSTPLAAISEFSTPEFLAGEGETFSSDWWRFGVFLYEIAVGIPPFRGQSPSELKEKILEGDLKFPPFVSNEVKHLINALLRTDPKLRMGSVHDLDEIKEHPFFKAIGWDSLERKSKELVPNNVLGMLESMFSDRTQVGSLRGVKKPQTQPRPVSRPSVRSRGDSSMSAVDGRSSAENVLSAGPSGKIHVTLVELVNFHCQSANKFRIQVLLDDACQRSEIKSISADGRHEIKQKLGLPLPMSSASQLSLEIIGVGDSNTDAEVLCKTSVDISSVLEMKMSEICIESLELFSSESGFKDKLGVLSVLIEMEVIKSTPRTGQKRGNTNGAVEEPLLSSSSQKRGYSRRTSQGQIIPRGDDSDDEGAQTIRIRNRTKLVKATLQMEDVQETDFTVLTPQILEIRNKPASKIVDILKRKYSKIRLYCLKNGTAAGLDEVKEASSLIFNSGDVEYLPKFQSILDFWHDADNYLNVECRDIENAIICFVLGNRTPSPHVSIMLGSILLAESQVQGAPHALSFAFKQLGISHSHPSQLRYLEYFEQSLDACLKSGHQFPVPSHVLHLTQLAVNPLPDVEEDKSLTVQVFDLDGQMLFDKRVSEMKMTEVETGARIFWETPLLLSGDFVLQMTHPITGRLFSCALHTAFVKDKRVVLRKENLDYVDMASEEILENEFKIGLYFT